MQNNLPIWVAWLSDVFNKWSKQMKTKLSCQNGCKQKNHATKNWIMAEYNGLKSRGIPTKVFKIGHLLDNIIYP